MTQYERIIALDEHRLTEIGKSTKNILEIYNYLKGTPITTIRVLRIQLIVGFVNWTTLSIVLMKVVVFTRGKKQHQQI